jgi:hypothetical protein
MPALVAGIHVFSELQRRKGVDGRDKPGHDELAETTISGRAVGGAQRRPAATPATCQYAPALKA